MHSFIHSSHFYSAPSSPLPLRGALEYSTDTVSEFHAGLAQGPYVAARAGDEPTTIRLKVIVSTKAPPRPTSKPQMSGTVPPDVKEYVERRWRTFPGDWDQLQPWFLFAYREVPVEGLMFSPFDIVFGRNIKGVLQLIMNSWLKDDMPEKVRSKNVIDYVLQLRDRIRSSLEIVNANKEIAKKRSKVLYDRNTKPVSYKEGELVLVLLPLIGKPLQAKFFG